MKYRLRGKRWPEFAAAKLSDEWRDTIQKSHRLVF